MQKRTQKQEVIYQAISDHMYKHKTPPTIDFLRIKFKYKSITSVQQHLTALKKKGYITFEKGKNRSIVILNHKVCAFCRGVIK